MLEAGVRCQEIDTYSVPSSCRATLDVNAAPGPAFPWNAGTSACTSEATSIDWSNDAAACALALERRQLDCASYSAAKEAYLRQEARA